LKTILLKKTSTLIGLTFILFFFLSSCKKNTEITETPPATVVTAPLEFVNFTIDNVDTSYTIPADSIVFHGRGSSENSTFSNKFSVVAIHRQASDSNFIAVHFSSAGIAQGSSQPLQMILQTHYKGSWPASPINLNITEYGALPGEFIAGNFSGHMADMTGTNHAVSCDFRVQMDY
jgi:hypothetical protein